MKIMVAYRNNALFEHYVPQLLEGLDVVGTFIVPAGVALAEVMTAAVVAARQAKANGAEKIFTDVTCRQLESAPEINALFPKGIYSSLDYFFQAQITGHFPNNTIADNFSWFASQIVGKRSIKSVVVVQDYIADHSFIGKDESSCAQLNNNNTTKTADWIATQCKALFPATVNIQIIPTLKSAMEYAQSPETLLILDRHCGIQEIMTTPDGDSSCGYHCLDNWPYPALLYMLPFETCADHLINRGCCIEFKFDLANMRKRILKFITR